MSFGSNELAELKRIRDASGTLHTDLVNLVTTIEAPTPPPPPTPPAPPVINSFTASPSTITQGQSTLLSWSTSGQVDMLTLAGTDGFSQTVTGLVQLSVSPTVSVTYTLTAINAGGSDSKTTSITVMAPPPSGFNWPGVNADATIPLGATVTINDTTTAKARKLIVNGKLTFAPNVATKLEVQTIDGSGEIERGTVSNPVTAVSEIVFLDRPLSAPDTTENGWHFTGKVREHGLAKTSDCRLPNGAAIGQTVIQLDRAPVGWLPGDEVGFADSRFFNDWSGWPWKPERRVIASVNGSVLTLSSPLGHDYPRAQNKDGSFRTDMTPHVVNLTRNVITRSENPNGVRGHCMWEGLAADIDRRYYALKNLGRTTAAPRDPVTNPPGRYPDHYHHMHDAAGRFKSVGGVIDGGDSQTHNFTWGMAIHQTNQGQVDDLVVWNYAGACIAHAEDGNEHDNALTNCIAIQARPGPGATGRADSSMPGREGDGFWANGSHNPVGGGPSNRLINCVAANCSLHGFTFFGGGPFVQFQGCETYGGRNGYTHWYINGASTASPNPSAPESFIDGMKVWNCWEHGFGLIYDFYNVTWRDCLVRGQNTGKGWHSGDYRTRNAKLIRFDCERMNVGINAPMVDAPSEVLIDGPRIQCQTAEVTVEPQAQTGGGGWTPQARTVRIVTPTPAPPTFRVVNTDTSPADQVIVQP